MLEPLSVETSLLLAQQSYRFWLSKLQIVTLKLPSSKSFSIQNPKSKIG